MSQKIILLLVLLATASTLFPHGLNIQFGHDAPYLWLRCCYDGDIPLAFGMITIHSPDGNEYQNGRSDRNGGFAFQPDKTGKWKVTVDDEMGHRKSVEIELTRDDMGKERSEPLLRSSPLLRWLLGISLILLLTASLYIWKKR